MRTSGLRTQLALLVSFLVVFALGASLSHQARSRARARLELSIHRDVAIANKLPRLKGLLRRLDLAAARFLETGAPEWVEEHKSVVEEIRATQRDLEDLFPNKRHRRILRELEQQLEGHFLEENRWMRLKSDGVLSRPEAARLLHSRRSYSDILELALNMHEVRLQDIPRRLREAERESRRGLHLVLIAGLLASAALALALSRYIIEPISNLSRYAAEWRPGRPWNCAAPTVSPEINALYARLKQLVEGFNEEYRKERELNRLKSQFVSLVSHELNNGISVIHAASTTLEELEPEPLGEKREKMYRILKAQTRSLSQAVANLLNAGRMESGRLALRRRSMDMGRVLKASVDLMELLSEQKSLRVTVSLPDAPAPVRGDPDALTLVATNLLSNAIKYTPPGGCVRVGLEPEGRSIRVYVQDTGIGIEPEERQRIFSGFYRTEAGRKAAKGFGIGLSLAKSIIEAHGSRLELKSVPGRGSTFSFLLPLWREEAEDSSRGSADAEMQAQGSRSARETAEPRRQT